MVAIAAMGRADIYRQGAAGLIINEDTLDPPAGRRAAHHLGLRPRPRHRDGA
ncbi:MAG: hypothetical protein WDN49_04210 [Acetobacteraceae bacterium]